jgi:polyphosphate glucokinase
VKLINDAAMQALGGYDGGRMLFLGLGTGLGSALVVEGHLQPLELAHLPYRKERTFEDYVGERGRKRLGDPRWRKRVIDVVERLREAMQVEQVLLGGGNARRMQEALDQLPSGTRLGGNADAFRGGFRMWDVPEEIAHVPRRAGRRSR